ncbi:uncharacterized protein HMPREF1541_01802 [Cyphellophora europaea CBS 101466]|uniref:Altered inheritance of mitochondria protein 41 n=1 Tax=Cyphellophora europaea (strain CBS 101466) TaxID=1220924 RepID=W2S235_CYPE1|nr:uncharacterized protein HMPREF1541_01802 [Cyphellophora europaea CBS 101466]ETN42645.1 hypothetical protein HMPREF1541_01802 [Cyphellophora europaea CBS 101466]
MASSALYASRALRSSTCTTCLRRYGLSSLRYSSTDAAPPLLAQIKKDLMAAMRAKDKARSNVLRGIISETTQMASGANPIKTDLQVLAMLKKRKSASQNAAKEAEEAKRPDLKEKQEQEIAILDEYAGSIALLSLEELEAAVKATVEKLGEDGKNQGRVMKELLRSGGPLDGKPVDKAQLAGVVKSSLSS